MQAVIAGGFQALAGNLDATSKIHMVRSQLQTAMHEYSQVFLPAKEKAGKKLDGDLVTFDRLYPIRIFGIVCMTILALFLGVILLGSAGGVQPVPGLLILVELVVIAAVVVKMVINSACKTARAAKKEQLTQTWDRWNRDEAERRARIARLEEELHGMKG